MVRARERAHDGGVCVARLRRRGAARECRISGAGLARAVVTAKGASDAGRAFVSGISPCSVRRRAARGRDELRAGRPGLDVRRDERSLVPRLAVPAWRPARSTAALGALTVVVPGRLRSRDDPRRRSRADVLGAPTTDTSTHGALRLRALARSRAGRQGALRFPAACHGRAAHGAAPAAPGDAALRAGRPCVGDTARPRQRARGDSAHL
jgi:hypothetical protein